MLKNLTKVFKLNQIGFSDLYQLVHMFVGEGQAKNWMKLAQWEHPERDVEKQTPIFWQNAGILTRNLHKQLQWLFQSLLIRIKFRLAHKNLMNMFITITINFGLFSMKFLVFL